MLPRKSRYFRSANFHFGHFSQHLHENVPHQFFQDRGSETLKMTTTRCRLPVLSLAETSGEISDKSFSENSSGRKKWTKADLWPSGRFRWTSPEESDCLYGLMKCELSWCASISSSCKNAESLSFPDFDLAPSDVNKMIVGSSYRRWKMSRFA